MSIAAEERPVSGAALEELVAAADTGARRPLGLGGAILFAVALAWSLFQLWYASPLPFVVGFVLNDTEARSIHLAFAIFLALTAYPALRRSPRDAVPWTDWLLAALGALTAAYLFLQYRELAVRPGLPTRVDFIVAVLGVVLLFEATRRSLGPALAIIAAVFLVYTFGGPWMPDVISHKGASIGRVISHQWLTTEGVFGVALGVATSFIFLYVLFGSLLEKAGAGNYMMQISFALLGHLRGGPAKVAVVSSALNGIVSGSSVSNVVTGGVFTIPMMKRTGLTAVKAGAIETASSVNGQIMPPVMGAAAFLMVEYVGIPYTEIVKHAALPAIISYIALFYIVHIEALKLGAKGLPRAVERTPAERALRLSAGVLGVVLASLAVYYGLGWMKDVFGDDATWMSAVLTLAVYLGLVWYAARFPDLALDDPNAPVLVMPDTWATARTGLHYILPIVVLLWCLMVEGMSPGLAAFWATAAMIMILLTQRPLIAAFRGERRLGRFVRQGVVELAEGLVAGARNMAAISVACGIAGIIVGTVTLTGMGLMMTDFVELISGGSVFMMLVLTAAICLVLGLGVPTTASYIVIATLIAPVIVQLGAEGGLIIPLIAVHLFVFYFGIMADVTPPVGLASFAAAAISGADPTRTGLQGIVYSLRTGVLPFFFVYNPQLLLIDLHSWTEAILVIGGSVLGMMLFAAGTMNFFLTRSRLWESAALLLVTLTLLRPALWLDLVYDPYLDAPAARLLERAADPAIERMAFVVEHEDLDGETVSRTVSLALGAPGETAAARLAAAGLSVRPAGDALLVTSVRLGSQADKAAIEVGSRVIATKERAPRPSPLVLYVPALALLLLVVLVQKRRAGARAQPQPMALSGS